MPEQPLTQEKIPANQPRVNQPDSGTFGDKTELQRLQQALPQAQKPAGPAQRPAPVDPQPVSSVRSNRPSEVPGIPAPVLLRPSDRPDVPVSAPLVSGAVSAPLTGAQKRLAILDVLANSPDVSDATREWAKMMIRILAG